ncbi:MAG: DUF6705 family protein [Dysgonomonas sp.]
MKRQLFLIFFSLSFICVFSQETYKIKYDTKKLEGTWVAISGNKSYEITFFRKILYYNEVKANYEKVVGSIKYFENNKLIKYVETNGDLPPLRVYDRIAPNYSIHYTEKENNKEIFGIVNFDINPDGKTARWYLLRTRPILVSTKEKFDIPKELTFTKK